MLTIMPILADEQHVERISVFFIQNVAIVDVRKSNGIPASGRDSAEHQPLLHLGRGGQFDREFVRPARVAMVSEPVGKVSSAAADCAPARGPATGQQQQANSGRRARRRKHGSIG